MSDAGPRWHWLTAGLLLAFVAAAFYGRQRGIFWGGDDADYALLARSLLEGRYVDLFDVGRPPHTTYPPGYPAMLAVWGLAFGDSLLAYTTLGILLMASAIALFVHLVTVASSPRAGFVAALVLVTNPALLATAGRVLSEPPMIFFAVLTVWLATRKTDRTGTAIAIATAVVCALTRTAGIAVVGGLGLFWLWKRRFVSAIALGLAAAVFVGGWMLWTFQGTDVVGGTTYVTRFGAYDRPETPLWRTILELTSSKTSAIVGQQIPALFALPTTPASRVDNVAWLPVSLCAIFGLGLLGWRRPVAGLMALGYGAVLFVWPFSEGRLLIPLLPLLLFGAVVGAAAIAGRVHTSARVPAAAAMTLLLAGVGLVASAGRLPCDGSVMSATPECVRPEETGLGRAIRFIETDVPADAVVMARRGEVVHYYTGNPTIDWPSRATVESMSSDALLDALRPSYILATHAYFSRSSALGTLIAGACERLSVAFVDRPHTLLLRVHPAGAPPAETACAEVLAFVAGIESE